MVESKISLFLYLLSGPSPELNESNISGYATRPFVPLWVRAEKQRVSLSRVFPTGTPLVDGLALWNPMAHGSRPKGEDEKWDPLTPVTATTDELQMFLLRL